MCFEKDPVIAVIGLGYVGLPLAVEFGDKYNTIAFDINKKRIVQLLSGFDATKEVTEEKLSSIKKLSFSNNEEDLKIANVYIVTVPTPIDKLKCPDLKPLIKASSMLGKFVSKGDIVIYESTVYPGATEEDCIPLVEKISGLKLNIDFYAGYSPERINPGDKKHGVTTIKKITSGSTPEVASYIDTLYSTIITAGTYKASSIKVAEAAKVIENTQRDLNIALVNELSLIFSRLGIETEEVLKAASTKWNFMAFKPGLVGGHCIGVDPYYLTHKAIEVGYNPEMILAGRRINDGMGAFVVAQVVKKMIKRKIHVEDSNILIMGLTFKENCPDLRNTRVVDIIHDFREYGANVVVYDPWVDCEEAVDEYNISPIQELEMDKYDAIVVAVAHDHFQKMGIEDIRKLGRKNCILYDIKSTLPASAVDGRL